MEPLEHIQWHLYLVKDLQRHCIHCAGLKFTRFSMQCNAIGIRHTTRASVGEHDVKWERYELICEPVHWPMVATDAPVHAPWWRAICCLNDGWNTNSLQQVSHALQVARARVAVVCATPRTKEIPEFSYVLHPPHIRCTGTTQTQ